MAAATYRTMIRSCLLVFLLSVCGAPGVEPDFLSLPGSKVILAVPEGWTVREKGGEMGMYSPDQNAKGLRSRIHLARCPAGEKTPQKAIDGELDRVTAKSPEWGSSCDRAHYKGSTPIETKSGIRGLRADFSNGASDGECAIVKYYFPDERGEIFRVCAHVYGGEARFREYERVIVDGLVVGGTRRPAGAKSTE